MKKLVSLLAGVACTSCLVVGGTVLYLRQGTSGFSARAQPTRMEMLLAAAARTAATPASVRNRSNPVPATPEILQAAMAHFADHCAQCHANNGSGQTMLGNGMYPKPPDMRLAATQHKSDGELFGIIENGVRLSGMPAFGSDGSSADESWALVAFLRHLPALTPAEEQTMQTMNPRTPAELREEQKEEDFLHGTQP